MDLDDTREVTVTTGQIIGLLMLLLSMLPRDVRADFCRRAAAFSAQDMVDYVAGLEERTENSTAPTSDGGVPGSFLPGHPDGVSEGEVVRESDSDVIVEMNQGVPEGRNEPHESDTEILSELFEEEH